MTKTIHMLKERTAKEILTRCGLGLKPRQITEVTVWESEITCLNCGLNPLPEDEGFHEW